MKGNPGRKRIVEYIKHYAKQFDNFEVLDVLKEVERIGNIDERPYEEVVRDVCFDKSWKNIWFHEKMKEKKDG